MADLSQNPFALLSLIAAPAVLTNSASVLVMSTTNRFLRASERMRALSVRVEEKKLTPGLRALVRKQVDRTERQAVLLLSALRAAYTAIGSFASASLISILGAGLASTRAERSASTRWRRWRWPSAWWARRRWSSRARGCSPRRASRC